jgi:hypothetical protein
MSFIILPSALKLSVEMLSVVYAECRAFIIMLSAHMGNAVMLSFIYAESRALYYYAECNYADCLYYD